MRICASSPAPVPFGAPGLSAGCGGAATASLAAVATDREPSLSVAVISARTVWPISPVLAV